MAWIPAILGLLIGGAVSGGIVGMSMLLREKIVVSGAVAVERDRGVVACNARVGQIEQAHNRAIEESVGKGTQAAQEIREPELPAALIELCKASASCLERNRL